jgi:chemotaxis protein methyltransferase CheR
VSSRTNTTTYFLREPRALEMIRDQVAVPAAAAGRRARIWCVGSSSGDEPYGLAMLCAEAGAPADILATDINPDALERARRARYPERNLRHVDEARRERWFRRSGAWWELVPELRDQVSLMAHDITAEAGPRHDLDVVLCRNVIVYFSATQLGAAATTMLRSLRDGGVLVLGASEWLRSDLRTLAGAPVSAVDRGRVIVYERCDRAPSCDPSPPAVSTPAVPVPAPRPARGSPPPAQPDTEVSRLREAGDQLLDRGHPAEALARYEQALALDPLLADLHLRNAFCHLHRAEPSDARTSLRRALFLRPSLWPAWLLLAELTDDTGQRLHYLSQASATARDLSDEPALRLFVGDRFMGRKPM